MTLKLLPDVGAPETHPHDLYRVAVLAYQAAWRRAEPEATLLRLREEMAFAHAQWRLTTGWEPSMTAEPINERRVEMRYDDAVDAFIESLRCS